MSPRSADERLYALDSKQEHPSPARRIKPPFPQLDDAALCGLPGDTVRTLAPQTEGHPAFLLTRLLAMFGNVVGRRPFFQVGATRHHANIFTVLAGDSSKSRKDSVKSFITELFKRADEDWVRRGVAHGLSSGEGLIWELRDREEDEDGADRDRRLLADESELASILSSMDRVGNSLSPILRQAYDYDTLRSMTKTSPGIASGVHVSMVAHITVDEFKRSLTNTEASNGFGNRFIIVVGKRSNILPEGGYVSEGEWSSLTKRLFEAIRFAQGVDAVTRDDEARALWHAVYPALSEGKAGLMGSMVARGEAHVVRLSLIYALMDRSSVIRRKHLEAALALWQYAEDSVGYIWPHSLGSPIADEILRHLRRVGDGGAARTDLHGLFGRNLSVAKLNPALEELADKGLAESREEKTDGPGRPAERWYATDYGLSNSLDASSRYLLIANGEPTKETNDTNKYPSTESDAGISSSTSLLSSVSSAPVEVVDR